MTPRAIIEKIKFMTMAGDEHVCENYLEIKPEKAGFFDLIRILYSSNLEKRDFCDAKLEERIRGFRHRWIIFISVLLQKVLLYLKKPVAALGLVVELFLNFGSCNAGYQRLFFNLLTGGRVVLPDKSSACFTSVIGNLDRRIELPTDIRNGDGQYNASLAIMASKLSYENQPFVRNVVTNHWRMEMLDYYNFWNGFQEMNTTHAFMFRNKNIDPNLIMVAFKGTDPLDTDEWRIDIDISWYKFRGVGRIHGGFMKALGLQKNRSMPKEIPSGSSPEKSFAYYTIREKLKNLISENKDAKFIVTGHSLGGALAILFASVLAIHGEELLLRKLEGVYTFGQPRVGDEEFGEYVKQKMILYDVKYFRYVYCNDLVPRVPYDDKTFLFKHFGPCLYFDSCYKGQVLGEEPNRNYFSLLYVVPKILNAIFEVIRGFILPWRKGKEYKEGWFMKLLRITLVPAPGVINHCPVDYVNSTRLGELPSSIYSQGPNLNLKQD